jgi:hypothetical protein
MTAKQEIAKWLNQDPRPFNEGLMLHLAYIQDKTENKRIERTKDAVKLYSSLRQYYYQLRDSNAKEKEVAVAQKAIANAVAVRNAIQESFKEVAGNLQPGASVPKQELPEELQRAWFELKTEQERWHTEMSLIGKDKTEVTEPEREQRAKLAMLIYNREKELMELGTAFNYYKEHGRLPDGFAIQRKAPKPKKKPALKGAEAKLYIKTKLAPNISKLKKKIAECEASLPSLSDKEKAQKIKKLAKWQEQLTDLQQQKTDLEHAP